MDKVRIRHLNQPDFEWIPDWFRFPAERLNLDYVPSDGARQRFGSPERLSYRDHVATIPIVSGKLKGGLSDPDRYPYQPHLVEILDHPALTDYVITAGNQSAKSTTIEDWIFRRAEYDPIDGIICYPDEDTVTDKFSKSLKPKLNHRSLKHLTTGIDDDITQKNILLASGMLLKAAWASSLMKLSAFSAGFVLFEECDKNKEKIVDTEAAIEKLGKGRGVDYGADFKLIRCTTLSGEAAPGAKARKRAQIFVDFLARCPHCGRLEYLSPERVGYVQDRTLWGQIESTPSYAWYNCGQCGKKWNEKQRSEEALVAGEFRARAKGWQEREKDGLEPQHDPRPMRQFLDEVFPSSAAISIPSLCLPTVKLCQWAAAKIAADTDTEAKHYFYNHHLDKPFKLGGGIHRVEDILRRSWGQPFGVVPSGWQCAGIYCGIDSQRGKFYYWVSAIGFSRQSDGTEVRPNLWQVDAGELPSVDESGQAIPIETVLKQLEDRVYRDEMGNTSWPGRLKVWNGQWRKRKGKPHKELVYLGGEYKIRMFVIDGRGNNQSNANITADAKAWCRGDMPRRRLHWGERLSAGQLFNAKFDKSAGIYIYHTDRHQLEQWVEKGLSIRPGKQGSIQVSAHCEVAHAEHLANIQVDPRTNRYVKPDTGSRDWRDCLRYSVLAYYIDCMAGVIQPV